MVWLLGFGLTVWEILRVEISKIMLSQQRNKKSCIFKCWHLGNCSLKLHNPKYFIKGLNKTFQMHLNMLPKLGLIFCCIQQKVHKMSNFWHSDGHYLGVNIIRGITQFFSSTVWALPFSKVSVPKGPHFSVSSSL